MAKESSRARVRVFFGEIEGDDQTIRDGLRSIAAAVDKTFQTTPRYPQLASNANTKQMAPPPQEQSIAPEQTAHETDFDSPNDGSANVGGRRSKKTPSYSFVRDLNLRPDGKKTLKELVQEKNPKDQQQR